MKSFNIFVESNRKKSSSSSSSILKIQLKIIKLKEIKKKKKQFIDDNQQKIFNNTNGDGEVLTELQYKRILTWIK